MKLIPRSSDISPGIDGICPGPFPPNGFTVLDWPPESPDNQYHLNK